MGEVSQTIKLPIIDLTAPDRRSTAASIRQACVESGFFYIVNHGLEKDLVKKLFDESRNFFLLPVEDKLKLSMKERRGYSALHAEKLDRALGARGDPKETFRVGPVDGEACNLNQWPSEELLPTFRPTIEAYHRNILSAAKSLLPLIALALDLEDESFFIKDKDSQATFCVIQFVDFFFHSNVLSMFHSGGLSCSSEEILGASAHCDFGMITLLVTDGVPGLQVCREKDRHPRVWEDVSHVEGAIIVNIGDMMERWTNGLFRSTLHRVNQKGKERYSAAFFCNPPADVMVECLESCCSELNPPRFPRICIGDYFRECFKRIYALDTIIRDKTDTCSVYIFIVKQCFCS